MSLRQIESHKASSAGFQTNGYFGLLGEISRRLHIFLHDRRKEQVLFWIEASNQNKPYRSNSTCGLIVSPLYLHCRGNFKFSSAKNWLRNAGFNE